MAIERKGLPAAQAAQMKVMMRDMDVAITRGFYLSSQEPAGLDRLIDRTLSGRAGGEAPVRAVAVFGEGRHAYFVLLARAAPKATPSPPPAVPKARE